MCVRLGSTMAIVHRISRGARCEVCGVRCAGHIVHACLDIQVSRLFRRWPDARVVVLPVQSEDVQGYSTIPEGLCHFQCRLILLPVYIDTVWQTYRTLYWFLNDILIFKWVVELSTSIGWSSYVTEQRCLSI